MKIARILTLSIFLPLFNLSIYGINISDSTEKSISNDTIVNVFNHGKQTTLTNYQIANLPFRFINTYGLIAPSAYKLKTGPMFFHGISSYGNSAFIDGMQVTDLCDFPIRAIEQYTLFTRGVPVNFGFWSGGVTDISTISSPNRSEFSIDLNTDQASGLQSYQGEIYANIFFGKNKKIVPSLLISGKFHTTNNNDPVWKHTQYLKDESLQWLVENPLTINEEYSSTLFNSIYVDKGDFIEKDRGNNNRGYGFYPYAKITIPVTEKISVNVGNYSVLDEKDIYNNSNNIFNFKNNLVRTRRNFDNYLRLEHSIIKNDKLKLSYNLNLQYSDYYQRVANPQFDDSFFHYGYSGKFSTYKAPTFELGDITIDTINYENVWILNSWDYDTLITYSPGKANNDLSSYTSAYFNLFDGQPDGHFRNMDEIILNNGLINGSSTGLTYGMFNNYGNANTAYGELNQQRLRLSFFSELEYGIHNILIGGEYNRSSEQYYEIEPTGLWNIMRDGKGLTNFHLRQLDRENPVLVGDGSNSDTVIYYRKYDGDAQRDFDKNLRAALGLPVDGLDYIVIDSYDMENNTIDYYDKYGVQHTINTPENLLSLGLFSAEELLNEGHGLVSYSGYNYKGEKNTNSKNPYLFFENHTITPHEPIFWSAYIQDEFSWKNLNVKIGLRFDFYNANQPVLKDEYSLYEINNVGEAIISDIDMTDIPSNIGETYAVYVNKVINPTHVTGYRNGDQWYDAEGMEISSPEVLDVGSGVSPFLKNPGVVEMSDFDWNPDMSFKDYKSVLNILPQISLDYTISNIVNLYTNYTTSTYNPTYYDDFRPDHYFYFSGYSRGLLTNPNLKPMKSGKLFTGAKAIIWKNLVVDIAYLSTFIDNYIIIGSYEHAFPSSYMTLVNESRRISTQGFESRLYYTNPSPYGFSGEINFTRLFPQEDDITQFRTSDMVFNMNLGYSFGRGIHFCGTSWMSEKIFQGFSVNVFYQQRSGVSYLARKNHINVPVIEKTPDIKLFNLLINKDFVIGSSSNLNIYLLIENLFNFKNVYEVYSTTGQPDDDGYLNDPKWQNEINSQINPDSYRLLYQLGLYNPEFYGTPRIWRIGISLKY